MNCSGKIDEIVYSLIALICSYWSHVADKAESTPRVLISLLMTKTNRLTGDQNLSNECPS